MNSNRENPADNFFPNWSWQARLFGGAGGIFALTFAFLVWRAGAPEYDNHAYWVTDYYNTAWQYVLTLVFLGVFTLMCYWILSSNNVVNPTHERQPMGFSSWGAVAVCSIAWAGCLYHMIRSLMHHA